MSSRTSGLPFALDASKLRPPYVRSGIVERTGLLDLLVSATTPTLVSVVAPPGYGKSTLLQQWAEHRTRPWAWLTLDDSDNDPVILLTYMGAALLGVVSVDSDLFRRLAVPQPSLRSVTSMLAAAVAVQPYPIALILDDVHVLWNHDCHDIIADLAAHVPAGSQLVAASREELPLPTQRFRVQGRIVEIGPDDLAMNHGEATSLLRALGVGLPAPEVRELVALTEGWPVPIYLAARSIRAGGSLDLARIGENRHMVAYVQSELLSTLPDETVTFLTRTALLDRLSGELCDAALITSGSADRLEALAQSNQLVIPLDAHRGWYRYHHLFRSLLRAELERREPELAAAINRRASQWCRSHGLPDAAVDYAMAAGDAGGAAQIMDKRALALYRHGRVVTARRWFGWFDERGLMERYPEVALVGAWISALTGHAATAERWAAAAEHASNPRASPDGSTSMHGLRALLHAGLCQHGMDQARADAETAERLMPPSSTWRTLTMVVLGLTHLLTGQAELADQEFAHAVEVADDDGALPAASVALAERALIALNRGEDSEAHALAEQACVMVDEGRLQDQISNVFVFAVAARIAIQAGDVTRAKALLAQAQRLRPGLTYALPHFAVQTRLVLIRVLLALADAPGARTVLREVDAILRLRPKLGDLTAQVEEIRAQVARIRVGAIGASTLTSAELRLLPLLQSHRTFREIGERLFVSPHTVKTQAISIYRKLGVSSRSDAVARAVDLGLLTT